MDDIIKLEWIKNNKQYQKKLERKELLSIMESLKAGFSEDNEISKRLVSIIPEVESIRINYDANIKKKIPIITYKTIDEKSGTISILREHKIIWSILDKYCS